MAPLVENDASISILRNFYRHVKCLEKDGVKLAHLQSIISQVSDSEPFSVRLTDPVSTKKKRKVALISSSDTENVDGIATEVNKPVTDTQQLHNRSDNEAQAKDGLSKDEQVQAPVKVEGVMQKIIDCLATFPTGEVAYAAELVYLSLPSLDLEAVKSGIIKPPYDTSQLIGLKRFAKELRAKRFGNDWAVTQKTPAWTIPGSGVRIDDPRWHKALESIVGEAGEYLGFGTAKLTTELHTLHLLEQNSVWRDYHNQSHNPRRVGTLLVILSKDYTGGEIAVGSGDKEVFFKPASTKTNQFFVASHNGVSYDNLPITSGNRLALCYDLCLEDNNNRFSAHQLIDRVQKAENELRNHVADWSEEVKTGQRENHPLLFVLNNNYPQDDFNANLNYMSAKDRATALALRVIIQDDSGCYGEYTLCAYLVAVTAKKKKRASGVRYAVIWGASLGEDVSDNTPDHTIIDGRSVLHTDEFYGGTNKRTRTCLMLLLKKRDGG